MTISSDRICRFKIHSINLENVLNSNETPHSRFVMEFTSPAGHPETLRPSEFAVLFPDIGTVLLLLR